MIEDNIEVTVDADEDYDIDIEDQFFLRLPPTPAAALRDAITSDVKNLKSRLLIQIVADMKNASIQFDKWSFPAKLYDLPTIIESCKTSDRKVFYKTGDISKIMIAQERDAAKTDKEIPTKTKDKDAQDKIYKYPHGITPPLKNIRKKRFRKTLKKKYVDWSAVEKEVKRLLRTDADAINFRYEFCNADDKNAQLKNNESEFDEKCLPLEDKSLSNFQTTGVAEYDIFNDVFWSSEESDEDYDENVVNVNKTAQKFESQLKKQESIQEKNGNTVHDLPENTQLSLLTVEQFRDPEKSDSIAVCQLESATAVENLHLTSKVQKTEEEKMALMGKLHEVEHTIANLQAKRRALDLEIRNIEHQALKKRFEAKMDDLIQEECVNQQEYSDILTILKEN